MDNNKLTELDNLIKAGQIQKVQAELEALVIPQIPRKFYANIANFSWRVGFAELGLRLLNGLIRDELPGDKPSEFEQIEYAHCLRSIGCSQESLNLLGKIKSKSPWVRQVTAFALISEWNYQEAAEILKNISIQDHKDFPNYQQEVIRINYLACLIFLEDWPQAHTQIDICLQSKGLSPRLLINLTELKLQCALGEKKYDEAEKNLKELAKLTSGGIEALYLKKWQAIFKSYKDKKQGKIELFQVRHEALKFKKWEIVRDCDLHIAKIYKNEIFLMRLLFATPFLSYREKILKQLPAELEIPSEFEFRLLPDEIKINGLGARNKEIKMIVDVSKGLLGKKKLKVGLLHHRLLKLLCKDLYRPHSVGSLFYGLFPDEFFNPVSSPNRIHQAIKGLREFFASEQLCLDVVEETGQYRLQTSSLITLILKKDFEVYNRHASQLEIIKSKLTDPFTAKQVAALLGGSVKTAQRLISNAVATGKCLKIGQGSKTSFTWSK